LGSLLRRIEREHLESTFALTTPKRDEAHFQELLGLHKIVNATALSQGFFTAAAWVGIASAAALQSFKVASFYESQ
jgi:hypothetical protein